MDVEEPEVLVDSEPVLEVSEVPVVLEVSVPVPEVLVASEVLVVLEVGSGTFVRHL